MTFFLRPTGFAVAAMLACAPFASAQSDFKSFLQPADIHADLDSLVAWVTTIHPWSADPATIAELRSIADAASQTFAAGAPSLMFPVLIHRTLAPVEDVHTGVDWGLWSREAGAVSGFWPGTFEVVNPGGEVVALSATGDVVDRIFDRPVTNCFPHQFQQGLAADWPAATLSDRIAAVAPAWVPMICGEQGLPLNERIVAEPAPAGLLWSWDDDGEILRLQIESFQVGSWREFKNRLKTLRDQAEVKPIRRVVIDLRNNGGGEQARALLLASLFTSEDFVQFHESIEVRGSEDLRHWAQKEIPLFRRLGLGIKKHFQDDAAYAAAMLRTRPGDIAYLNGFSWPADRSQVFRSVPIEVLTNGRTASAAAVFAEWLKDDRDAQILGIPAYGRTNRVCGNAIQKRLPHSQIPVTIASVCWTRPGESRPFVVDQWQFNISSLQKMPPFLSALLDAMRREPMVFSDAVVENFAQAALPIVVHHDELKADLASQQIALENLPGGAQFSESGVPIDEALNELLNKQREAKDERDAGLRMLLPMQTWSTFDRLLKPEKPAVLHFGIHDRMNCNVCKPE